MKFQHKKFFKRDLESVWKILLNTKFSESVYDKASSDVEWLEDSGGERTSIRRSKITFRESLPKFIMKLLKRETLSYEQNQEVDHEAKKFLWKIRVRGTGGKLKVHGSVWLQPAPGGCERFFESEVEVKVPLVGRKIEKEIIKKVQQGQEALSQELDRWIAEGLD